MAISVRRRGRIAEPGEELLDASVYLVVEEDPARRVEVRSAAAELVEAAAAEARAVAAQLRAIHRLWSAAQAARTAARHEALAAVEAAVAAGGVVDRGALGPVSEPEHQLVLDVAAEVGPALRLPAGTAARRVEDAVILAEDLAPVLAALEEGRITWNQAQVMVEQWRELVLEGAPTWTPAGHLPVPPPVEAVHRLITELLERAGHATAAQLRGTARARRKVLVAGAEELARRTARKNRGVWVEPAPDGMAYLHAFLDAHVAVAAHARLEALTGLLGENTPGPDGLLCAPEPARPENCEERSVGELRADVLADLLLDGELPSMPGFPRGVRATVSVMVPAGLLAAGDPAVDHATDPAAVTGAAGGLSGGCRGRTAPSCAAAVLSGYGPISAQVARQLAAGAGVWHRLLTHPFTGVVLDHDRTVYAVPADLRRLVVLRDGTCRFPGCRRRAEACDLDHTTAWAAGGPTAEHNLAALCRHHHRIKHRNGALGRWIVRRIPVPDTAGGAGAHGDDLGPPGSGTDTRDGPARSAGAVLEWTSPGGLVHRTVPEHEPPDPRTQDPAAFIQVIDPPDVEPAHVPPPFGPADDPPPF